MEPLFHVGDRVVIEEDIRHGHKYFFERDGGRPYLSRNATVNRLKYVGVVTEIVKVGRTTDGHIYYSLDIDSGVFVWPASMLLPAPEAEYGVDIGSLF